MLHLEKTKRRFLSRTPRAQQWPPALRFFTSGPLMSEFLTSVSPTWRGKVNDSHDSRCTVAGSSRFFLWEGNHRPPLELISPICNWGFFFKIMTPHSLANFEDPKIPRLVIQVHSPFHCWRVRVTAARVHCPPANSQRSHPPLLELHSHPPKRLGIDRLCCKVGVSSRLLEMEM